MKKLYFLYFCLWLVTFVLIFELSCRIYFAKTKKADKSVEFNVTVPFLDIRITPSVTNKEDQATIYNINSFGFRGKEFSREKEKGVYRIIAIGDSCTFGVGVSSDEYTYPVLLEKKLNRRLKDKKIEVINAGVPGYLCLQSLISFDVELADYQPDMVILYTGWKDLGRPFNLEQNMAHGYDGVFVGKNRFPFEAEKNISRKRKFGELACVKMIQKWHYKILRWKNKDKLFKEEKRRNDESNLLLFREAYEKYFKNNFYVLRSQRIFERCLNSLLLSANSRGTKVVVLTLPQLLILDMPEGYYKKVVEKYPSLDYFAFDKEMSKFRNSLYLKYDKIIKESAKRNNCLLIDAASYFPRDDSNINLFFDYNHLNDKGNDLLTEIIYNNISNLIN